MQATAINAHLFNKISISLHLCDVLRIISDKITIEHHFYIYPLPPPSPFQQRAEGQPRSSAHGMSGWFFAAGVKQPLRLRFLFAVRMDGEKNTRVYVSISVGSWILWRQCVYAGLC